MPTTSFYSRIPPPLITREHGSWAVLLVPMFVSLGVVGRWSADFAWVVAAGLSVFLEYVPAQVLLRHYSGSGQNGDKLHQAKFWGLLYAIPGLAGASILVLKGYVLLPAFGAAGVFAFIAHFFLTKKYSKSMGPDLAGVAGLTLGGPGAYYVLTGALDMRAAVSYLLNLLFFGWSVFYVHMKIESSSGGRREMSWGARISAGRLNLLYQLMAAAVVGLLIITHAATALVAAAFIPMILHAMYGTMRQAPKVRFKNLGLVLLAQSLVFGSLLTIALR